MRYRTRRDSNDPVTVGYAPRVAGDDSEPRTTGHRIDDVPLERRFCNHCNDEIRYDGDIGDVWWEADQSGQEIAVVLCRDCA